MRCPAISILLACCLALDGEALAAPSPVRVADLNEWLVRPRKVREDREFIVTGMVTHAETGTFVLADGADRAEFSYAYASSNNVCRPQAGDCVTVRGTAALLPSGGMQIGKVRKESVLTRFTIEKTGRTTLAPPEEIDFTKIGSDRSLHLQEIRTVGTIVEIAADEIDVHTGFVTLRCGTTFLPVIIDRSQIPYFRKLKDATVEINGLYHRYFTNSLRKFLGPILTSVSVTKVVRPSPEDPFALPTIDGLTFRPPAEVATLGRRSAHGVVLAVWDGNSVLVKTDGDCAVKATLAKGEKLPAVGKTVVLAGYPEVNLFHANLRLASWRAEQPKGLRPDVPVPLSADSILGPRPGATVDVTSHGRTVTLRGIVQDIPQQDHPHGEMLVKTGAHVVRINPGEAENAFAGLTDGCEIDISGVCVLDGAPWQPHEVVPRLGEVKLVIRTSADIRVISRPPWMTTERLWTLVALLLTALAVAFVWGTVLSRIIRRRTHALVREQVERARSEFRVGERTRLAIELHDALSQGLTGVASQIEATASALAVRSDAALSHLETAARMLQSCRTELRHCLWDLRGNALENPDFEAALRATLAPVASGARLYIRFTVRRSKMTDTLAHAILCIVRELVSNAIRHGGATEIRIAGAQDPQAMSFSVTDNGCGFDPQTAPGPNEGHFGLSGIRERVLSIGGTVTIAKPTDRGTRIVVRIGCPQNHE